MPESIYNEIKQERHKQDLKWGMQDHSPVFWLAILIEEIGELAQAILKEDWQSYRAELVQVIAVAVAMLECYDRNAAKDADDV